MMPCLQHFLSGAVSGELQPVRPWDSAALWTSIATGHRATNHGVLGAFEVAPCRTRIRPSSRWTRTAPAVWSILSDSGYRTHAFGWPASHPAEPINGVAVSDLFADFGAEDSIHPRRLLDTLLALRLLPTEIDAASLVTLLPGAAELNPMADQRLFVIAQFLASTASLHAAATWALEHEPWDFAAVRYAGLARLVHVFGPAYIAMQAGEHGDDADLFGDLIPNALRFFDMLLRRLVELAGSDASIMLISEQGWVSQPPVRKTRRSRPEPGVLVAAGPAFKPRRPLQDASVCDVAPTILDLFGLHPEPGTHGRAWRDVLRNDFSGADLEDAQQSGEESIGETNSVPEALNSEPPSPPDDEPVAHLLALGYREQPDDYLRFAIEQLEQERQWRFAEAWIDNRQYEQAARVLECLVQSEPTSKLYRSMLAETYFRAGEYDACRAVIVALQADGLDTPLGQLGLAAIATLDEKINEAVEHLRRAEAMQGASAAELDMIGQLYLRLRQVADADRAFDAAIAHDPELGTAHEGRAIALLVAGDPPSAERHAREAVRLNPHSYKAQYHLGIALTRQNRSDEAIEVLRAATQLDDRSSASAHRHLANLLERRGDRALAFHHRALADRRGRRAREPQFEIDWFNDDWPQ